MRVLHVVESAAPDAGCVAVCVRGLIDALRGRGVEAEMMAAEPGAGAGGERLDRLADGSHVADVVHIHGWDTPHLDRAARAALRAGKSVVVSPYGSASPGRSRNGSPVLGVVRRFRSRRLLRAAGAVTFFNPAEQALLARRRVHRRLVELPLGIDVGTYGATPARSDDARPINGRVLLVLGPIHPAEGLVPLLKSIAELGHDSDGWTIVLAGSEVGPWWRMLEPALRRKGGEGRVVRVDAAEPDQQKKWLSNATALAAPSLQVRCPVSVLQAMAAGVAVLTTTCSAPGGIEGAALSCGPTRHEMKASLRALFEMSDADRSEVSRRGRELARARFDWSVLVDRYIELYRHLG